MYASAQATLAAVFSIDRGCVFSFCCECLEYACWEKPSGRVLLRARMAGLLFLNRIGACADVHSILRKALGMGCAEFRRRVAPNRIQFR